MRFLNYLHEAQEEIDTKNTNIGFSMVCTTSSDLDALSKSALSEVDNANIQYVIKNVGNSTTYMINPMVVCSSENLRAISLILKEFASNKVNVSASTLFFQNKAMTPYNIAWFYFQYCLNIASKSSADKQLKNIINNKEQFPYNIFKNLHVHNKLLKTIEKMDSSKDVKDIIATLKDTNQFAITPVADSSGTPIISLSVLGGLQELRTLVTPITKIKSFLSVYKAAQDIDSSDAFKSFDEFKSAYDGNFAQQEEPNTEEEDPTQDSNYQRGLNIEGDIIYKINPQTKIEFLKKYPWMDQANAHGQISIYTSLPDKPFSFTGEWNGGEWKVSDGDLIFNSGTFNNGKFNGGYFFDSKWENGEFELGKFFRSTFNKGTFNNGRFIDSSFEGGTFTNGTFENSEWKDGNWVSGTWKSGKIWSDKYRIWVKSVVNPKEFLQLEKASWIRDQLVKKALGGK